MSDVLVLTTKQLSMTCVETCCATAGLLVVAEQTQVLLKTVLKSEQSVYKTNAKYVQSIQARTVS